MSVHRNRGRVARERTGAMSRSLAVAACAVGACVLMVHCTNRKRPSRGAAPETPKPARDARPGVERTATPSPAPATAPGEPSEPTFPAPAPHLQRPLTFLRVPEMDPFRPYDYPGVQGIRGRATGFFHVEHMDGRAWLIDPKGQGALMIGGNGLGTPSTCHMLSHSYTAPGSPEQAKVIEDKIRQYAKVVRKFGSLPEYFVKWDEIGDELGLTVDALWSVDQLTGYRPLVRQVPFSYTMWNWQSYTNPTLLMKDGEGYNRPDVFHPGWEAQCDSVAREHCGPFRGSPWVIGYYIENEIRWGDRYSAALTAWRIGAGQPSKQELVRQAEKRFGTIAEFNAAFGSEYGSFTDVLNDTTARTPVGREGFAFLEDFCESFYERFYSVVAEAVHRHAPNHLILGTREIGVRNQAASNPALWKVMGKYCDVVSFNMYFNMDPVRGVDQALVNAWSELAKISAKPLMNTEWSILSRDTGMTRWPHQVQIVENQAQRAQAYRSAIETFFAQPWAVGNSFFCPGDEVALQPDGSAKVAVNWGVFRDDLTPYRELFECMKAVHPTLADIHATRRAPAKKPWAQEAQKPWKPALPTEAIATDNPITVGDLRLTIDRVWVGVDWKGTHLGRFFPYTTQHRFDDGTRWSWPARCRLLRAVADADYTAVELEFSTPANTPADAGGGAKPVAGTWSGGGWIAAYQLWIPASGAWFASRHLWTENTGDRAWILPGISHSMSPAIGGSFAHNRLGQWEKRAEWEESWINRALGVGLTSQAPSGRIAMVGWMMGTEPKSDYTETVQLDRLMNPGQRWVNPDSPPCFHAGFSFVNDGPYPYAAIRTVTDRILGSYVGRP